MNSTRNNQTFTRDPIYSIESIPYLILNAIEIVVGAIGKLKIRNKLIKKDFLISILIKGNILLFVGILCTKKLKAEISNIIILNMTIAHFYSSVVVGIFAQIGVIFGEKFFNKIFIY